MNTVECPCCSATVSFPDGSDEVLCPHCGEVLFSVDEGE